MGACLDGMPGRSGRVVSLGKGVGSFLMLELSGGRLEPPMGGSGALEGLPMLLLAKGSSGRVVSKGGEAELLPSPLAPSTPSFSLPSVPGINFFGIGFPPRGPLPLSSGIEVKGFSGVRRRGIIAPGRG